MGVRRGLVAAALAVGLASAGWMAFGGEPDVDVDGTWLLVSGTTADGPFEVPGTSHVSLVFDDDVLGGKGPCNDYGAHYDLDGSTFDLTDPGVEMTFVGCDGAPGILESAYLSALPQVDTIARDGDLLVMSGPDVELELRLDAPWPAAEVVGHRWRLVSWTDDAGTAHEPAWEPGREPFVRLDGRSGGRVTASTGCREMDGRWEVWRGAPAITEAQWTGACPDRLMDQEVAVGTALSEPVMELRTRQGEPELVVRYAHGNGPAEVVYRR